MTEHSGNHGGNGGKRVLVVEDDPAIRRLACDLLQDEGYDVRGASTGEEALATLSEWEPRLILLDLMMPVMDGTTFHASLPESARDIPLLVLSGSRSAEGTAASIGAAVLTKPFDIEELVTQVENLIGDAAEG